MCKIFLLLLVIIYRINAYILTYDENIVAVNNQTVPMCPCLVDDLCDKDFFVPMKDSLLSHTWYSVPSKQFFLVEGALQCQPRQVLLPLNEGSFVLLSSGELVHVHSKLVVDANSFCLKKTLGDEFILQVQRNSTQYTKMEAEVCVTPPQVPKCCEDGNVVEPIPDEGEGEGQSVHCQYNSGDSHPLNPYVSFDGSMRRWPLTQKFTGLPSCGENLTVVPLGDETGFGSLHYVSRELQFRWQTHDSQVVTIDSTDYCIGNKDSFSNMRPVAAFCSSRHTVQQVCNNTACFGKCCSDEEVFDLDLGRCEPSSFVNTWKFDGPAGNHVVQYGFPSCQSYFFMSAEDSTDTFQLLENGSLFISSWGDSVSVPNYCVDAFQNQSHMVPMALVCFQDSAHEKEHSDESTLPYVVLLMITVAHLMISTIVFIYKVHKTECIFIRGRAESISSADGGPFRRLQHFHVFVFLFMTCSAVQVLVLAVHQLICSQLSEIVCIAIVHLFTWLSVTTIGLLCSLIVHEKMQALGYNNNREWAWLCSLLLLYITPLVVALLAVLGGHFTAPLPPPPATCHPNALMRDPWATYPVAAADVLLLLVSFGLLFLMDHSNRSRGGNTGAEGGVSYARAGTTTTTTTGTNGRHDSIANTGAGGSDAQLSAANIAATNAAAAAVQEKLLLNGKPVTVRDVNDSRWWLSLKLCSAQTVYFVAYISVWQAEALAFWVFCDIATCMRCLVISSCLWLHHCKCRQKEVPL